MMIAQLESLKHIFWWKGRYYSRWYYWENKKAA